MQTRECLAIGKTKDILTMDIFSVTTHILTHTQTPQTNKHPHTQTRKWFLLMPKTALSMESKRSGEKLPLWFSISTVIKLNVLLTEIDINRTYCTHSPYMNLKQFKNLLDLS